MLTMDTFSFAGKKALVRVDLNVPQDATGKVTDDTRARAIVPTVNKILKDGGSAILMSHLGRPKGKVNPAMSLRPVADHLAGLLGKVVIFATDCVGPDAKAKAAALKPGEVLVLENLRFHPEEEGGDEAFSKSLSELGDVYVNDAFGTAHRAHASTTIVAKFFPTAKLFGYLMQAEIDSVGKVLGNPQRPMTAIVGGSKVSSKIEVLQNLIGTCDELIIGGGMANTFVKAMGGQTGASLVDDDLLDTARGIIKEAEAKGVKLHIPTDAVVADAFAETANTDQCAANAVPDGWMALDIGPASIEACRAAIGRSKTLLWNGPMGVFEIEALSHGTAAVAKALTAVDGLSVVGGGDSAAAVRVLGHADDEFGHISTGGGASLEFLEGKELPGISVLEEDN